jgi:hypothetical protein
VYEAFLPEILGPGDIFMHDGASVHRAYIIRGLLEDMGVEVVEGSLLRGHQRGRRQKRSVAATPT